MPDNMLSDMEFESRLNELGDNQTELIKFIARQQYQMSKLCPIHDKKIKALQNRTKREMGATGGIGAFIGVSIAAVIDYFMRR